MDKAQIARMIDHTILKAEATEKEVLKLCKEAVEYNFASVCIIHQWFLLQQLL